MYPRLTPARLHALLAPTSLGEPIRQYRVAVADDGTLLAGAMVSERFKVMEDHIDQVPRQLELMSRVVPILPPDRVIRSIEVNLAWHAPDRVDVGRRLWDAIRHEWRDRATHAGGQADPARHTGRDVPYRADDHPAGRDPDPVQSPVPLDERRPVYVWR